MKFWCSLDSFEEATEKQCTEVQAKYVHTAAQIFCRDYWAPSSIAAVTQSSGYTLRMA